MSGRASDFNSVTQAIKDRINIKDLVGRYVQLRHTGGNRWMAPCPFHQETKGSFSVNEEQGFFYCFGCQASGDIFDFYARINGIEFKEALEQLAQEAGVSLREHRPGQSGGQSQDKKKQALKLHDLARTHFRSNLASAAGKNCRDYIAGRELDEKIVESFELGWSLDDWNALTNVFMRSGFTKEQGVDSGLLIKNDKGSIYDRFRARLMFPIKSLSGQVIAFGGRIIDNADAAKYINSSDSPIYKKGDNLYGLFQARGSISAKKSVILTEGYMDVLTLHQFGYKNACGVLGTALTPEQIKRLGGFASNLELIFDGDAPGRKAALRSAEMILSKGLNCRVVILPDPEDIDSLLKKQGVKAFEDLREKAPDGLAYCMRTLNASFSPREISAWVKEFLQKLEHPEHLSRYISELAIGLGLEERIIRQELGATAPKHADAQVQAQGYDFGGRPEQIPPQDRLFLEFAVRCPRYINQLAAKGLAFALQSSWAAALWARLMSLPQENFEARLVFELEGEDKSFCMRCLGEDMPPRDEAKETLQFEQLCASMERIMHNKNRSSHMVALGNLKGSDAEDEFLRAIQLTAKKLAENKHE